FVVEELARSAQQESIKWAISGRSREKLAKVLTTASAETGIDVTNIPTIEADVQSEESLRAMTSRTRLVLNTVGPFQFFGEQVVKACIASVTNHLDISGSQYYMESMQLKYNKAAQEKGIYIASACGWDSIPFLKKHFNGELNSVETFFTLNTGPKGLATNVGTFQSAIHGIADKNKLKVIRSKLYREICAKPLPQTKFPLVKKSMPFRSEYVRGWCVPFPGCDPFVVQRTQRYKYEKCNERPTQIESYLIADTFVQLIGLITLGAVIAVMAPFRWGRSLLESYPSVFSFGRFTKTGPTREQIMAATFRLLIVGKGWSEKLSEPTDEPTETPNKTVMVEVTGFDPGYRATSTCLVQSGITLIKELDKLPEKGGVFTPGLLFEGTVCKTQLNNRVTKMSITFNYAGKVVLITGSSSGIGAATAALFASAGAQVVVTGRNVENIAE
ncbi:unnamed protein product, partial [Medioppia subpectinata]